VAAGVLVVTGRQQGGLGQQVGEGVEFGSQGVQRGAGLAGVPVGLALAAVVVVGRGGGLGGRAGTEVLADDTAVDPAGAGVVQAAAAGFPGHRPAPKRRKGAGATQHVSGADRATAHAVGSIGYFCSLC
jgi:hypothetical protein